MKIKRNRFDSDTIEITDEFVQRAVTAMKLHPHGVFTNAELRTWLMENDSRMNNESSSSAADNIIKGLKKRKEVELNIHKWRFTSIDREHQTSRQQ